MEKIHSKTIIFIAGAFVNHACWDDWRIYFERQGYTTMAPSWPGKDADAGTLRGRQPDKALASITLPEIIEHYTKIINELPEIPILIGHSFGGLISQVLMNNGLVAAVIAIHATPPQGVIPYEWNFLKSNIKGFGYFTSINKTYLITFKKWQVVFTNGMSFEDQKNAYYASAVPESKRVIRGGLTRTARVDFTKSHAPLLFLAGSQDNCIPAHLCQRVFNKYKDKKSVTDFKLKDRNHYILGLPTWKEDAHDILDWISSH